MKRALAAALLVALAGCTAENPSLLDDAGAADRGARPLDGGGDLAVDAPDAIVDAMIDAMSDAIFDAMPDAIADATPDAMPPADAAPADAAPSRFCPGDGGRTSGIADPFAIGAFCDALYICLGSPPEADFVAAFTAAFPEALCRAGDDCYDFGEGPSACTCGRPNGGFCRVFIQQVDDAEHAAACALAADAEAPEIVCGGDF